MKIMLVDDSDAMLILERTILETMLIGTRADILTAHSGAEAVSKASAHRPDLILMDSAMPMMGGIEACRLLKQRDDTAGIPVVLVTTSQEAEYFDNKSECCRDYLCKPLNPGELFATLTKYLGCLS